MKKRFGVKFKLLVVLLLVTGCASSSYSAGSTWYNRLESSIHVSTEGERVNLALQVTNRFPNAAQLEFASGQSFDFVVSEPDGDEVWRWSSDQMFTQAERTVSLAPGETVRYEAVWVPPTGRRGSFVAVGRLAARNLQVEQSTRFELR